MRWFGDIDAILARRQMIVGKACVCEKDRWWWINVVFVILMKMCASVYTWFRLTCVVWCGVSVKQEDSIINS